VSVSVTLAAITVTVHVAPVGRSLVGSSTSDVAPVAGSAGVALNGTAAGQPSVTAPAARSTGSLKLIVRLMFVAWFVAPLAGEVGSVTRGAASVVNENT
jgi:hypothetical protein